MTLAIDKRTDKVIGQVTTVRCANRAYGSDISANEIYAPWKVVVLTRDGYRNVAAASVRLERTED